MNIAGSGILRKMRTELGETVRYQLPLDEQCHPLNELIGQHVQLVYEGQIECIHCGRKTRKSYNQGYCYPCCRDLARCDQCIVRPQLCHHHEGTCREPQWGDEHCMIPHFVYLANTTGLKVGITRHSQIPTRWMDQGAVQALPLCRVDTRRQSGLLEVALGRHIADKTNWRALLKADPPLADLPAMRDSLRASAQDEFQALQEQFGVQALQWLETAEEVRIAYPVQSYPDKTVSLKFDKTPCIEGELRGIKGQYLLFAHGAINIRSHAGYRVTLSTE